jgi:choline dehydrogenase-like flavoprotein
LTILDRSWVIRVIFEYVFPACISLPVSLYWFSSRNDWAVGVEYISEGRDGESGQPTTSIVKASRLVVVSAGAFGSPMILERSGIGGKEVLEKNGVPQVVDLPGVGEHYMGQLPSFVRFGIRNS